MWSFTSSIEALCHMSSFSGSGIALNTRLRHSVSVLEGARFKIHALNAWIAV